MSWPAPKVFRDTGFWSRQYPQLQLREHREINPASTTFLLAGLCVGVSQCWLLCIPMSAQFGAVDPDVTATCKALF